MSRWQDYNERQVKLRVQGNYLSPSLIPEFTKSLFETEQIK